MILGLLTAAAVQAATHSETRHWGIPHSSFGCHLTLADAKAAPQEIDMTVDLTGNQDYSRATFNAFASAWPRKIVFHSLGMSLEKTDAGGRVSLNGSSPDEKSSFQAIWVIGRGGKDILQVKFIQDGRLMTDDHCVSIPPLPLPPNERTQ